MLQPSFHPEHLKAIRRREIIPIKIIDKIRKDILVSIQRSAFSHQLYEQIQKDMIGDKVDHFASDSLNFLFLLKADS